MNKLRWNINISKRYLYNGNILIVNKNIVYLISYVLLNKIQFLLNQKELESYSHLKETSTSKQKCET